jgi:hypothetical protein
VGKGPGADHGHRARSETGGTEKAAIEADRRSTPLLAGSAEDRRPLFRATDAAAMREIFGAIDALRAPAPWRWQIGWEDLSRYPTRRRPRPRPVDRSGGRTAAHRDRAA